MNNLKKLTLILVSILAVHNFSKAQSNFYKFRAGAGAGATLAFVDIDKKTLCFAGYGTLDYLATPYVSLGLELQKGQLAGGDSLFDNSNKQFVNSYLTGTVNLRISFGEFITDNQRRNDFLNFLSGVYGGAGLGFIRNKISNVRYYDADYYPGEDNSTDEILPLNLGVNIYFPDKWGYNKLGININLQTTIAFGEGMDGYTSIKQKNDIYSFLSLGLKYDFGFIGLDRRR